MNSKILITGGTGYIGNRLLQYLAEQQVSLISLCRRLTSSAYSENVTQVLMEDLACLPHDADFLPSSDVVIHLAAKAHVTGESLSEFKRVNTEATLNFAKLCANSGIKRFIFLSSIGVNGISNTRPFNVADKPDPVEDYAVSKLEAEIGLKRIAADTGMEVVIIRPPLVYGPNAPGNFGKLAKLAQKNLPLPLGAINNQRSLVALDNLVDLVVTCIDHPKAANQTFLVSDDQDVSTTELLQLMTRAAGKKPWLIPVPMSWLKLAGKLTGKQAVVDRLCGNLQVDITHTKQTLGWTPPVTVEEGIARCFAAKG
ncbi:MAG: SDR family oxidoreductase [Pseudomonadota bacterium]